MKLSQEAALCLGLTAPVISVFFFMCFSVDGSVILDNICLDFFFSKITGSWLGAKPTIPSKGCTFDAEGDSESEEEELKLLMSNKTLFTMTGISSSVEPKEGAEEARLDLVKSMTCVCFD